MVSFWKIVDRAIMDSDVVLEVIDARLPELSRNAAAEDKVRRMKKPLIIVLNKCDLISQEKAEKLKKNIKEKTIFVSSTQYHGIKILREEILKAVNFKKEEITVGIMGYPNVGKSSVINALSGGGARVSSKAGYTRGVQKIKAGASMMLLDTPGIIDLEKKDEITMGVLGAKNSTHLKDPLSVAEKIIGMILSEKSDTIKKTYQIEYDTDDTYEILLQIGARLNFKRKGNEIDENKTSAKIIEDWQKGKLNMKDDKVLFKMKE